MLAELAAVNAAYAVIKEVVSNGRELGECAGQLGSFFEGGVGLGLLGLQWFVVAGLHLCVGVIRRIRQLVWWLYRVPEPNGLVHAACDQ